MIRPALLVAATALAIMASAPAYAGMVEGKVVRILDGDTVEILVDRHPIRVRLASINAPELRHSRNDPGQPFAARSRQSLTDLVARQTVTVADEGKDRYGRMIGTIHRDRLDVNAEQVRRGMAWVYRKYSNDPKLLQLEQEARDAKRGLWADPNPVAPWDYRRSAREPKASQLDEAPAGQRCSAPAPDLVMSWLYRRYLRDPWSRQLDQEARRSMRCS